MKQSRPGAFRGLAVVLLLASGGLPACVAPAQLSLAEPGARPQATPSGAPRVWLTEVIDQRQGSESLGQVAARNFSSADLIPWLQNALLGLNSREFSLVRPDAEALPGPRLKVRLVKAYVDSVHASKIAVVVIETELSKPDLEQPLRKYYRGQCTHVNWASGSGEVVSSLRVALADCLDKLGRDLGPSLNY